MVKSKQMKQDMDTSMLDLEIERLKHLPDFACLFKLLTNHHLSVFELMKYITTLDFQHLEKFFPSRNKFFVWTDVLYLSGIFINPNLWLEKVLGDKKKVKLCKNSLRKCYNLNVLNCCKVAEIRLTEDQRLRLKEHEKNWP